MPAPSATRVVRRLVVTSIALWVSAAAIYGGRVLVFGERPAYIHVRWAPGIDDAARRQHEQQYSLTRPEPREGRTWGYALTNVSRRNVMAIVNDPAVEDTHNINRAKFRPGLFTPRFPYETRAPWVPVGLNILSGLLAAAGAIAAGLALVEAAVPPAVLAAPRRAAQTVFLAPGATSRALGAQLLSWVATRIPAASAEGAAAFRIAFGTGILLMVASRPISGAWAAAPQNALSPLHERAIQIFVAVPALGDALAPWIFVWGALFIAGAFTRTSFAMLTLGLFGWALLYTTRVSYHTVSSFLLALCLLLWSRWGDAWSVDAWRRRRGSEPTRATPQEYGYTVWVPGLVLGVVFLAAAFSKLRESGFAWILNGTVKYHFLSDARQAMVDWGLRVGQHPALAVLLSFAAVAIECVVIVGVLSRAYRYRLAAGFAALSILTGFVVLQGLRWPGWWLLLLSFLPWHLVRPAAVDERRPVVRASGRAVAAIVALFALQLVVSAFRIEVTPLLSTYDMYSTTYADEADYAYKAGLSYWLVGARADGTTEECRVSRSAAEVVLHAIAGTSPWQPAAAVIDTCFSSTAAVSSVVVEGRRNAIDWAKWPPAEVETVPMAGPVTLASRE